MEILSSFPNESLLSPAIPGTYPVYLIAQNHNLNCADDSGLILKRYIGVMATRNHTESEWPSGKTMVPDIRVRTKTASSLLYRRVLCIYVGCAMLHHR